MARLQQAETVRPSRQVNLGRCDVTIDLLFVVLLILLTCTGIYFWKMAPSSHKGILHRRNTYMHAYCIH